MVQKLTKKSLFVLKLMHQFLCSAYNDKKPSLEQRRTELYTSFLDPKITLLFISLEKKILDWIVLFQFLLTCLSSTFLVSLILILMFHTSVHIRTLDHLDCRLSYIQGGCQERLPLQAAQLKATNNQALTLLKRRKERPDQQDIQVGALMFHIFLSNCVIFLGHYQLIKKCHILVKCVWERGGNQIIQ